MVQREGRGAYSWLMQLGKLSCFLSCLAVFCLDSCAWSCSLAGTSLLFPQLTTCFWPAAGVSCCFHAHKTLWLQLTPDLTPAPRSRCPCTTRHPRAIPPIRANKRCKAWRQKWLHTVESLCLISYRITSHDATCHHTIPQQTIPYNTMPCLLST